MNTEVKSPTDRVTVIRKEDRESLWFLGDYSQIILDASHTEGKFMLTWNIQAPGSMPPVHEHAVEDEIIVIVDGGITFWTPGNEVTLGAGDTILLPKDLPHTLQTDLEVGAKFFLITAPTGFEQFLRDVAEPATYEGPKKGWTMDEETAQKLAVAAVRAGINIIAPPGTRP
jgi:mannose-6-phosphate isomerase-like protein (cupin superfamily)